MPCYDSNNNEVTCGFYSRRRVEEADVRRSFLGQHDYTDSIEQFLEARSVDTVTNVCDDIMKHVSGTHKMSMLRFVLTSESQGAVMSNVAEEVVDWVADQIPERRRLEEEQTWNVTRQMASDTWSQSLGYLVAETALIEDGRMDAGAQGFMSSFGNEAEGRKGCTRFVNLVNDEVQDTVPLGLEYHAKDEVVSIDKSFAVTLGINHLLPSVTLATGRVVLLLFNSCRRFANQFGDATCPA